MKKVRLFLFFILTVSSYMFSNSIIDTLTNTLIMPVDSIIYVKQERADLERMYKFSSIYGPGSFYTGMKQVRVDNEIYNLKDEIVKVGYKRVRVRVAYDMSGNRVSDFNLLYKIFFTDDIYKKVRSIVPGSLQKIGENGKRLSRMANYYLAGTALNIGITKLSKVLSFVITHGGSSSGMAGSIGMESVEDIGRIITYLNLKMLGYQFSILSQLINNSKTDRVGDYERAVAINWILSRYNKELILELVNIATRSFPSGDQSTVSYISQQVIGDIAGGVVIKGNTAFSNILKSLSRGKDILNALGSVLSSYQNLRSLNKFLRNYYSLPNYSTDAYLNARMVINNSRIRGRREVGRRVETTRENNKDLSFLIKRENPTDNRIFQILLQYIRNRIRNISFFKRVNTKDASQIGKSGELKVTLQWWSCDDLDLWVYDPFNNKIYYRNKRGGHFPYIGILDVDANAACRSHINCTSPAENIYWKKASSGEYRIMVNLYSKCGRSRNENIDFIVTVFNQGKRKEYRRSVSIEKQTVDITKINLKKKNKEFFDGFNSLDNWVISTSSEGKGVGGNVFKSSNINLDSFNKEITLRTAIKNGIKEGAQILSKVKFPIIGTFATKVKYIGNIDNKFYTIKSFFTYTADKWKNGSELIDPCIHIEHDFELLTEINHPWIPFALKRYYSFVGEKFPLMQISVHEKDESLKKCNNPKRKTEPIIPALKPLDEYMDQYLTLVLTVKEIPNIEDRKLLSDFYIVSDDGQIIWHKSVISHHDRRVQKLQVAYNTWSILKERQIVENGEFQEMKVKWFYYNPKIIFPIEAKKEGERLENILKGGL